MYLEHFEIATNLNYLVNWFFCIWATVLISVDLQSSSRFLSCLFSGVIKLFKVGDRATGMSEISCQQWNREREGWSSISQLVFITTWNDCWDPHLFLKRHLFALTKGFPQRDFYYFALVNGTQNERGFQSHGRGFFFGAGEYG